MAIETLTPIEQKMVERLISLVSGIEGVKYLYLFGSRARLEGHAESDIDIAVVVRDRNIVKRITGHIIDLSIKVAEELGVSGDLMLSPIVIEESLLKAKVGIGRKIREEGILLWSKKSIRKKEKVI
ncbi:MAG: nucleotidyltransferase domain-containing protein [Nitrospirae bacterium]|nr:nucleotidyltransferase domain-containing protein [Nitrospirota bacterium]